ncbi:MAG TPA: hypothetical protein VFY40_26825 [Blastocatellia bacterium]|nr:hypothetical protein [Blastocatellia bacterium]
MSRDKIALPADLEREAIDLVFVRGVIEGQGTLVGVLKLGHQL